LDPAAKRLPGRPGEPGRLLAGLGLQRVGEREQAGADSAVPLAADQPAQFGRVTVRSVRIGSGAGMKASPNRLSPERLSRAIGPSPLRRVGMSTNKTVTARYRFLDNSDR
jgi:hypothetical protein